MQFRSATLRRFAALALTAALLSVQLPARAVAAPASPAQIAPRTVEVLSPAASGPSRNPHVAVPTTPVEVGRSAFSTTQRNPDGTLTTSLGVRPLHWPDAQTGRWMDFNNALQAAAPADAQAGILTQNTANGYVAKLGSAAAVTAGKPILQFAVGPASISAVAVGAAPASASTAGNAVTYAGAYPATDLRYTVDNERIKEDIVLRSRPAAGVSPVYSFDLSLSGVTASALADGSLAFKASDGSTPIRAQVPFMTDASPATALTKRFSGAVSVKLIRLSASSVRVTLLPDAAWLLDPARVYPVVIDPTVLESDFQPLGTAGQNATIDQANPSTNYNGNPLLNVGLNAGGQSQQALIKFPSFDQLPTDSAIVSATLSLYAVSGTAGMPVTMHHNAQPWDPATVTWNTAPGTTSTVWDTDTTNPAHINLFDATALARGWLDGSVPKEGVRLISGGANGQTTAYYSSFYSDPNCSGCQPELLVNYVPASRYGADRLWTYSTQQHGGGNTSQVNLSTGAELFSHNGGSVDARGFSVALASTYTSTDPFYLGGPNPGAWYGEGWSFGPAERLFELSGGAAVAYKDGSGNESRVYLKNTDAGTTRSYLRPLHYDWTLTKDIATPPADPSKVWTLTADVGAIKAYFDAAGKLTRKQDRNGNYLTYAYDTSGRLTRITDVAGRNTTLTYAGTGGRLSRVTDMAGRVSTYAYDGAGNLTSIQHAVGTSDLQTTSLGYDDANQLVSVTDPRGNTSAISYQALNRFDTAGSVEDWLSGTPSRTTIAQSTAQHHSGSGSLKVTLTAVTASAPGRVKKVLATPKPLSSVAGEVLAWVYLPAGSGALQAFLTVRYPDNASRVGSTQTLTAGAWNALSFSGAPLDPSSPVKEIEIALGAPTGSFSGSAYIDDLSIRGTVEAFTDAKSPQNTVVRFSEDFNARTTTMSRPDPAGTYRDTVYRYTRDGQVDRVTDPLGNVTAAAYDGFLRVTTITPAGGGGSYSYAYYPNSNQLQTATNQLGETTHRGADLASGDTLYLIDPLNEAKRAGNTSYQATIFSRDPATGNLNSAQTNSYAAGTNLDANLGAAYTSQARKAQFTYTTGGLLATMTDPKSNVTTFGYDLAKGYLTSIDAPAGYGEASHRMTTISRNPDGSAASSLDPKGQTTTYTYDGLGRLRSIGYGVVGGVPAFASSYTLDADGNMTAMSDQAGSSSWTWDANNRLTAGSRTQNGLTKSFGAAYFADGLQSSLTTFGGQLSNLGYDAALRLTSQTDPNDAGRTISYAYDAQSRRTDLTFPSGLSQHTAYDPAGRVALLTLTKGAATLQSFTYAYGFSGSTRNGSYANGNLVSMAELNGTTSYGYDNLNRISSAVRSTTNGGPTYNQAYAYDLNDNRTGFTSSGVTTTSSFDAANQLVSLGASAYRYDRNANLTAAGADTLTYDAANHFTGGSIGGVSQAFSYDGLGRRVSRAPNGSRLDAWYDQTGLSLETGGAAGTYLRDPSGLLLSVFSSGALRDYGRDRLGSLTAMVSTAGVIDNAYQYDPWGQRITNTGSAVNPFKFTAGYQSTSSGLFDFAARSYDPATGRFTQADPRPSSVTDINRFAYVAATR